MRSLLLSFLMSLLLLDVAHSAECSAVSSAQRVPVLELYTSEGCNSCPPADRWVSELRTSGHAGERVVVLAFHVDYWDKLGWTDRFAQARYSDRQRLSNERNGARVIYTPQLMLNGKDYRRGSRGSFDALLDSIARGSALARIQLAFKGSADRISVTGSWSAIDARYAQGWLALYENRLSTAVTAGENQNKRLEHDFVVRDLAGPFPKGNIAHDFQTGSQWKRRDLAVAAFVQDAHSGDVLQALTLSACTPGA